MITHPPISSWNYTWRTLVAAAALVLAGLMCLAGCAAPTVAKPSLESASTRLDAIRVEAEPVTRVVDTTGAGDLYAAGFLFGLTTGREVATCARIGGITAAAVLGQFGARPESSLADLVRERLG